MVGSTMTPGSTPLVSARTLLIPTTVSASVIPARPRSLAGTAPTPPFTSTRSTSRGTGRPRPALDRSLAFVAHELRQGVDGEDLCRQDLEALLPQPGLI